MSELAPAETMPFEAIIAEEVNDSLDRFEPYRPFTPSRLDLALVAEAALDAYVTWEEVFDWLDCVAADAPSIVLSAKASDYYEEHFPDRDMTIDRWVIDHYDVEDGKRVLNITPALLVRLGTSSANRPENRIVDRYDATKFCFDLKLTRQQGNHYFKAAEEFQDLLFNEIEHVSEDELLRIPLLSFGTRVIDIVSSKDQRADFHTAWADLLDQEIGRYNFLGEHGDFIGTTEGLMLWVNERVQEYLQQGHFADLSKWHYGPDRERPFDRLENHSEEEEIDPAPACHGQLTLDDLLNASTVDEVQRSVVENDPTIAQKALAAHTIKVGGKE